MRIAISGAGVAGPTLAYWLTRAGHEATLIEVAPQLRTGGYVIDFWGLGYEVGCRMGLEQTIQDRGYHVRSIRSVTRRGRTRANLSTSGFRRATGGRFSSLPRGDLASAVYSTIDGEVETVFGDSITAITEHEAGVRIDFRHGRTREFELAVGADGLHSTVRRLAFDRAGAAEHYLGCLVAAAVVDGYRPRDDLVYVTYSAPGHSVGRFALRDDRTLLLFVFRCDRPNVPDHHQDRLAVLQREFLGLGWECPAMIDALRGVDDLYFDAVSQVRLDRWWRGRTALVGDAAASISLLGGEGTGLAMTEAYVLAGELRTHSDHRQAFEAYQARLGPFIAAKQAGARRALSTFAPKTALSLVFRDAAMRVMATVPGADRLLTRSLSDDLELPDYPM
ncbi:FAD-binding domain [Mycolicibacterium sp.]|uniref:FAD-binding domain n=1 Tax=Mycolicibacterium sp. TaxID=2320850 RepID=UPI003D0F7489